MANKAGYGARGFSPATRAKQAATLTVRQQQFVDEYLIDLNATQAAVRAGYSPKSASILAGQLMKEPKVERAIAEAKQRRARETQVDAAFILRHLSDMAHADMGDIVDELGNYRPIHEWPKIWRQMLSSCDIEELYEYDREAKERTNSGRVTKLKFVDRMRVIELLGKHIDIRAWQPDAAVTVNNTVAVYAHLSTEELARRHAELSQRINEQLQRQLAIEGKVERVR